MTPCNGKTALVTGASRAVTRWCMDTAEDETRTGTLTRQRPPPTELANSWTDGRGDARPVG